MAPDLKPDPDPLVKGMDPRIQIRIHTKMSWIRNTASFITGHLNGLSVANQLLVFERILKCNHPSLGEGNKEKLMAFYILLLQYLQAVLQPQSLSC
jgi:hypothetical protein